jgi:hypothetical protein
MCYLDVDRPSSSPYRYPVVPSFQDWMFPRYARQRCQGIVPVPAPEMDVFKVEIMKNFTMRHDEVRDLCSIRNSIF